MSDQNQNNTPINNKVDYLKFFGDQDKKLQEAALKVALDTRKFEIEMYWKRATYFWAFIAVSFAGFFALVNKDNPEYKYVLVITIIGWLFSISWYLVNRGSKFWQENWEWHVDYLEDEINGPLYKTVINPDNVRFLNLNKRYPISVSKINQLLSLMIALIWSYLFIDTLIISLNNHDYFKVITIGVVLLIASIGVLVYLTKSDLPKEKGARFVQRRN